MKKIITWFEENYYHLRWCISEGYLTWYVFFKYFFKRKLRLSDLPAEQIMRAISFLEIYRTSNFDSVILVRTSLWYFNHMDTGYGFDLATNEFD